MQYKNFFTMMIVLVCTLLTACTKEYNYESDSADRKAYQMGAVASFFDAASRQPEMMDKLLETTKYMAEYDEISELVPLDDRAVLERGMARGESIGMCIEAMARQPELQSDFEEICIVLLGKAGDGIITEEINMHSRTAALPALNTSIARNPEMEMTLKRFSNKVLGTSFKVEVE